MQVRTLRSRAEQVYEERIDTDHKLLPWMVRHAGWLITHYQVKADGKTPYERLRHRPYRGEVAEFAETVHYKDPNAQGKLDDRWFVGVWLGKSLSSDEHYVGTADGVRRCRSIWRRPGPARWSKRALEVFTGTPWDPEPRREARPAPRGVYITLDRQIEHGGTPGCPACFGEARAHSAACRARFEELLRKRAADAADEPEAAPAEPAQQPAAAQSAQQSMDLDTTGRKRSGPEAETAASSADGSAGSPAKRGKMIGGLPTLHENGEDSAGNPTPLAGLLGEAQGAYADAGSSARERDTTPWRGVDPSAAAAGSSACADGGAMVDIMAGMASAAAGSSACALLEPGAAAGSSACAGDAATGSSACSGNAATGSSACSEAAAAGSSACASRSSFAAAGSSACNVRTSNTNRTWVAPLAEGAAAGSSACARDAATGSSARSQDAAAGSSTRAAAGSSACAHRTSESASADRAAAGSSACTDDQDPEAIRTVPIPERQVMGTKSGTPLDLHKVMEGRQKELDSIHSFGVKRDITMQEAKTRGLKFVHAKWLDDVKPTPTDPKAVRSRLVATEVATYAREDVSQSTPPLRGSRLIVSLAATKRSETGEHKRLVARYDISVAFFHAESTGRIAVLPPKGLARPGWCWLLERQCTTPGKPHSSGERRSPR